MAGGVRIPNRFKEDMNTIVRLLNKAQDSIITDTKPERTQGYIKKANEICKKYIGEVK